MLQKVQLLAAIIHKPDLLILDEPFSGLDPISTRLLRDLVLEENRRGATILFSTHVMPQAEDICQNVIMIHRGRKVLDEALATIRSQYDPRTIEFDPLDARSDVSPIASLPGVDRVEPAESGYKILLSGGTSPAAAMRRIIDIATPARLELSRPRLEDIFINLVSTSADTVEERTKLRADLKDSGAGKGA
jgi:ABC-2 type transport system ATP-binding protein